jgi:hypothetical protein
MRSELSRSYITEFFRILRRGGTAMFQIPGQYSRAENALAAPDPARLPDAAFNAHITVNRPIVLASPGTAPALALGVRNFSTYIWPGIGSANPLTVSLRWFDQCLRPAGVEESVALPRDTMPGNKTYVTVTPRVPAQPGFYLLQIDIMQSGVARGCERGSAAPFVAVAVYEGAGDSNAADLLPFNAQMEYHGLPRAEVEALIARSGGEVIAVFDDAASNADWPGHLYLARKS